MPGSVVVPAIEGHRPLLVEVQALVGPAAVPAVPRRSAQGLDNGRLALLLAVLDRRVGLPLGGCDVYASAVGGVRVVEPGADLAFALALASAHTDVALPDDLVACGEVGLGGELRQVSQTPRRLAEAARLGFAQAIVPASAPDPPAGIAVHRAGSLSEAVGARPPPGRPALGANFAVAATLARCPPRRSQALTDALAAVAPGRPLREGLDRILQANMGALIVVGDGPEVLDICSGGFLLDAEFTPQRLSELAKMDGAMILAPDASRIARANVHLVPNPNVPTSETGTRHRTAERVARSIDVPVISVSEDMSVIAVYYGDVKHPLEPIPRLLNRANQALQTLERYKTRLDAVSASLSALEVEDLVTVRDVVSVLQRTEMVRRIADEIDGYIVELGIDGRLVRLQLEELMGGVEDDRRLVVKDYFRTEDAWHLAEALDALADLSTEDLVDLKSVTSVLHLPGEPPSSTAGLAAARLPAAVQDPAPARQRRSSASSTASAACRRSCGPRSTTSTTSKVSATPGPRRSRKASPAWPRPASSTATADLRRWAPAPPARRNRRVLFDRAHHVALRHTRGAARPERASGLGVALDPDIGGLRPLFDDLCRRLAAEHGWTVSRARAVPGPRGDDARRAHDHGRGDRRRASPGRAARGGARHRMHAARGDRVLHGRHVHAEGRRQHRRARL